MWAEQRVSMHYVMANLELDSCVRTTAVSVSIKFKLASCFEVSYTLSEHYDVKLDLKYY